MPGIRFLTGARRRQLGFTLIEILIVIALLVVIVSLGATLGRQTLVNQELERAREVVRSELARAQGDTIAGTRDSEWGVAFTANSITRFVGPSFAGRNPSFDATTSFPNATIAGPAEIVFVRPTGVPVAPGTITINIGNQNAAVMVNAAGAIEAQ